MSVIQTLETALQQAGVEIPIAPDFSGTKPRKWIVHAEADKNILLAEGQLLVQTGDKGAQGVFLADALSALQLQSNLYFVVFESAALSTNWVIEGSQQYTELQHTVAMSDKLDPTAIGDAIEIRSRIFAGQCVFQPMSGVVTVNHPIPLSQATKIVVPVGLLTPEETQKLPAGVAGKILTLQM
jgi:hypothetical protein